MNNTPLHENHIYTGSFPNSWSSFTELSEVLSAGLEFSFCPSCWFVFSSQQFHDQIYPRWISDHPNTPSARNLLGQFSKSSPAFEAPLRNFPSTDPLTLSLCCIPLLVLHLESSPVLHWSVFPYSILPGWNLDFATLITICFGFFLTPRLVPLSWVSLASDALIHFAAATWFFTRKKVWVVGCYPVLWFLTLWFSDCTQGKPR